MALSVVHFRLHHGKETESIHFNGNGIKLIDLKKEIVEKKKFTSVLDFELQIVDENKKGKVTQMALSTFSPSLFFSLSLSL
jgi:hypothetical protein